MRTRTKYQNGERVATEKVEDPPAEVKVPAADEDEVEESVQDETKADRFARLAGKRTQVVLDKIRVLGNCAKRAQYSWTNEQALSIVNAVKIAVSELEEALLKEDKGSKKFSW